MEDAPRAVEAASKEGGLDDVLVLGTRNLKKLRELEELLAGAAPRLAALADFPDAPIPAETGATFLENATLKAATLSKALGRWVLGEDSGLCVDALGGRPGVYSARYAGEPTDDERNNDKLLFEMRDVPDEMRSARYVCAAVVCDPRGEVRAESHGVCEGRITRARRGAGGFGYDPLFLIVSEGRTFGESPPAIKRRLSHRAEAIRKLRPLIMDLSS
jgi:XTP/dITP diphosphohydrolase